MLFKKYRNLARILNFFSFFAVRVVEKIQYITKKLLLIKLKTAKEKNMLFAEFVKNSTPLFNDIEKNQKLFSMMCSFCKSEPRVVQSWFSGKYFPRGKFLIKFREIFVGAGWTFEDYNILPQALQNISALIAHNHINPAEDYKKFEFSSRDELFRPLTTPRKLSPERISRLEAILKEYEEKILDIKEFRIHNFDQINISKSYVAIAKKSQTTQEICNGLGGVEYLMVILSPEVENLCNGPADSRTKFRESHGAEKLFKFSNLVHNFSKKIEGLCSETALEINKKNGGGK